MPCYSCNVKCTHRAWMGAGSTQLFKPSSLPVTPTCSERQPHSPTTSDARCSSGEVIPGLLRGAQSPDAAETLAQEMSSAPTTAAQPRAASVPRRLLFARGPAETFALLSPVSAHRCRPEQPLASSKPSKG